MFMKLEKMGEFFDNRIEGYEEHQLGVIESAAEFYLCTANELPAKPQCKVLDLGCGTGLELDEYFNLNPSANVTGIDLAAGMLKTLKAKHSDKALKLIIASYFDEPFGECVFDAAVSVESLHHFTFEQKKTLYKKLHSALADNGYFILTDYLIESDDDERKNFAELARLKRKANIADNEFYHYDTPLTVAHEIAALNEAGFSSVKRLKTWGNTTMIKAIK